MAARRLTAALTERSRHTGASGDAAAASRSRAKSASAGVLREPSAGVAQPNLVGGEHQDAAGLRPLGEPPEALGEASPIGGRPLPDDGYGAPSGKGHGGVHRHGAIPLEADGKGRVRYGGGDAVDDGHGVEAFQENAPPAGRDGQVSQQALQSLTRS